MQLEAAGITQPHSTAYQIRLKFGKQNYLVIELARGEDAASVAKKLRELAAQVEVRNN